MIASSKKKAAKYHLAAKSIHFLLNDLKSFKQARLIIPVQMLLYKADNICLFRRSAYREILSQ